MSVLNKTTLSLAVPATLAVLGSGCAMDAKQAPSAASKPEVASSDKISDSFGVALGARLDLENPSGENASTDTTEPAQPVSEITIDKARVVIAESALDKEFLLQGGMIFETVAPTGSSLKSRVVAFKRRADKIYMVEATQGHVVTNDIPSTLVLGEFPILGEADGKLTIDFNAGMASLLLYGDWHATDFEGLVYDDMSNFMSVKLRYSFLDQVEITKKNQLYVRQVAQATLPIFNGLEINLPMEMRYYLSPYRPDAGFKPTVSTGDFRQMGFFETATRLKTEGYPMEAYATKWDLSKPVVYAVSANTPENMKQAVKDGVLYWNKALGREIVQVVDAPAGVTAPNPDYNIVQWVTWDTAGFAYADAQMDPRTGQITNAQVYLTSAFSYFGKIRARNLARDLKLGAFGGPDMGTSVEYALGHFQPKDKKGMSKSEILSQVRVALRGFERGEMCDMRLGEQFATAYAELQKEGATEEQLDKVVQDYVREVTAHEIGHTLGLRHNFAGSLATNYPLSARKELVKQYLTSGSAPAGVVTSSSVMEYQAFEEGAFTGDQIAKAPKTLEYDTKALQALYEGKKFARGEVPAFCTDSHLWEGFVDCRPFDVGASFLEWTDWTADGKLENLPLTLVGMYIQAKAPLAGEPSTPVEELWLPSGNMLARYALGWRAVPMWAATQDLPYLRVQRTFPVVDPVNAADVTQAQWDYTSSQISRLGGLPAMLPAPPAGAAAKLTTQFEALVRSDAYRKGLGLAGQPYEFSEEEITTMVARVGAMFKQMEPELAKVDLQVLGTFGTLKDDVQVDALLPMFLSRIEEYVFATTDEVIMADIEVPGYAIGSSAPTALVSVKLPVFKYPTEVRTAAAFLVNASRNKTLDYAAAERVALQARHVALVKAAFGGVDPMTLNVATLPKKVARWITSYAYLYF